MRDDTERELDREKIKIAHFVFMAKITIILGENSISPNLWPFIFKNKSL